MKQKTKQAYVPEYLSIQKIQSKQNEILEFVTPRYFIKGIYLNGKIIEGTKAKKEKSKRKNQRRERNQKDTDNVNLNSLNQK